MKLTILGAGQEVGRSAILLEEKSSVVLDYGTKIEPEPPKFPLGCKPDYAIISHAHLDHCGGAPILFKHSKPPIFMTDVTLELTALLVKDSMKIARKECFDIPFSNQELKKMIKHTHITNYGKDFSLGHLRGQLFDAGHIPGSAGILISGSKKVFYTGDIQTNDSHLLHGSTIPKSAEVLITESTYCHKNHAEKKSEEKKLIELIEEAFSNDGNILLPAFAVGRSQELLLILEKYADILAIDGMVRTASEIIEDYGARLKNAKKLRTILSKVKFLRSEEDRNLALKKHQIIIASAGMLGGGPAIRYLRELKDDINSKVIFSGFLVEGTPGRYLLQTGIFKNPEENFKVKCQLHKVDLSAHAGKSDLFRIIQKLHPEKVICIHGEDCQAFAKEIEKSLNIDAFAPKNGETIKI